MHNLVQINIPVMIKHLLNSSRKWVYALWSGSEREIQLNKKDMCHFLEFINIEQGSWDNHIMNVSASNTSCLEGSLGFNTVQVARELPWLWAAQPMEVFNKAFCTNLCFTMWSLSPDPLYRKSQSYLWEFVLIQFTLLWWPIETVYTACRAYK